jgi:hypothetical protein
METTSMINRRSALSLISAALMPIPAYAGILNKRESNLVVLLNKNGKQVSLTKEFLVDIKDVYGIQLRTLEAWFKTWSATKIYIMVQSGDRKKSQHLLHLVVPQGSNDSELIIKSYKTIVNTNGRNLTIDQYNDYLIRYNEYQQAHNMRTKNVASN